MTMQHENGLTVAQGRWSVHTERIEKQVYIL